MKFLRSLLLPAACFAAAWLITTWVGKRTASPPPAEPPVAVRRSSHTRPVRVEPRKAVIENLVGNFKNRPISEWSALWEKFADTATLADFQTIPMFSSASLTETGKPAPDVLRMLAAEELAVRGGRAVVIAAESFAALAEADPDAAWNNLTRNNRVEFSCAALRTLGLRDPLAALRRLESLPEGFRKPVYDENSEVDESPIGSIFGAWARRDPAAAATSVKELPASARFEAANHLAMTWAYRDGPAAIRYCLDFDPSGKGRSAKHFRMDIILRASFRTHPAATAKLMAEHRVLRKAMSRQPCTALALRPWYNADPEGVIAWLLEPSNEGNAGSLLKSLNCEPEAAASLIRRLAAAGETFDASSLMGIYRHDREVALSLAEELGLSLMDNPEELHRIHYWMEPDAECDRWLDALERTGDPDQALAELGWTQEMAFRLAHRAAVIFPDKVAEIAKLVPASKLEFVNLYQMLTPEMKRFWPAMEDMAKPQAASYIKGAPSFPTNQFSRDPATVAEELLATPGELRDINYVIEGLAPHDLDAARAWLSRVPDGPARAEGELALAKIQAPRDPLAALAILTARPPADERVALEIWNTCLHRLVATGGDWQSWVARLPAERLSYHTETIAESLAKEARLLELARKPARD